jgi:hypothetical protein
VVNIKFIMCQPAIFRFEWELEVSLTRMRKLGIKDIILLFSKHNQRIPSYLKAKYDVEVHEYDDRRVDKSYIPSIKPYLWAKFLQEDRSRENETYFYLDSDVIFREIPNVIPRDDVWYGSDCSSYLGVEYIDSKGSGLLESMCRRIGVNPEVIRNQNPVCGAQWVISNPTFEYWLKVYEDSTKLYKYLNSLSNCDIQKWTAEMWAQLWNAYYFGRTTETSSELDFCWATDKVDRYYETKIYHNAGVVDSKQSLFFKGQYIHKSPFKDDLSFVDKTKASIKYVEALCEVEK